MEKELFALLCVIFGALLGLLIVSNWWTAKCMSKASGLDAADYAKEIIKAQGLFLEDVTNFIKQQRDPAKLAQWMAQTTLRMAGEPRAVVENPPEPGNGQAKEESEFVSSDRV